MLDAVDLLLSLVLVACQTPLSAPVTSAVEHRVLPSETNPAIAQWNSAWVRCVTSCSLGLTYPRMLRSRELKKQAAA
jgi:hypothetical protein